MLQQYLPFTVLKPAGAKSSLRVFSRCNSTYRLRYWNDVNELLRRLVIFWMLQQYLPFTVLKLIKIQQDDITCVLQQYLPFTVLKLPSFT